MRTAQQMVDLITLRLGQTPDSRHDLWADLNEAGREVFTQIPWNMRRAAPTTLVAVASQEFIALPSDWAQLDSVNPQNAGSWSVQLVTIADIMRMRSTPGTFDAGTTFIAFGAWVTQAAVNASPTQRCEIYPTPTTNGSPTLNVTYLRRWRELSSGSGTDLPNIPNEFEAALVAKFTAIAWRREYGEAHPDEALYLAEIERLKAEEAGQQVFVGRIRGGADRFPPYSGSTGIQHTCNLPATFNP